MSGLASWSHLCIRLILSLSADASCLVHISLLFLLSSVSSDLTNNIVIGLLAVSHVLLLCSRAGFKTIPYHAKIGLKERTENLDRFRNYGVTDNGDEVSVLICTDLASRGLDIPAVAAVVQLQFAGNVVAHLHRMGRCGRAGQRNGRGIVFYDSKQRELIEVVREAESMQETMVLEGDVEDPTDEEGSAKVKKAFSRRRGFSKKRKKLRRDASLETS